LERVLNTSYKGKSPQALWGLIFFVKLSKISVV